MVFLPYTNLCIGPTHTIAAAGSYILVLENLTGNVTSTHTLEENVDLIKSGPVRCLDVDFAGRVIAAVGEDKMLKLWEMDEHHDGVLRVINRRELPKKPTQVRFTKDGQTVLVSDKFGDVFSYPLPYEPLNRDIAQQKPKDALSSHENPSNGTLVLGHASPVNCFVLDDDERYIITADRDEHIRVSRYPKGYLIEMYCLGHSKFVSALHIPPTEPMLLISGGGDAELKVWDWLKGSLRCELKVWELVERFLIVRAVKGSTWGEEGDGDGDGKVGKRKQKRKGKGKERERADEGHDEVAGSGQENGVPAASVDGCVTKPPKVLVIQQIESVLSSSTVYVLFSAVGATALFAFPFKPEVQPSEILHFDFAKPVLGFSVVENEMAVVYLDGGWTDPEAETVREDKVKHVRVVGVSSGQLTECMEYRKELIESLNSKVLIPANAAELQSLDLYGALRALPKHSSDQEIEEASLQLLPIGAPELSASNYKARAKAKGQESTEEMEMSKKEMGRMKGKMKVLEKAREQGKGGEKSPKRDLIRKRGGEGGENEGEKGVKKVRVDGAGSVEDSCPVAPANSRFSPTAAIQIATQDDEFVA